jgi:mannose-1-phosphate guanylyltransferase
MILYGRRHSSGLMKAVLLVGGMGTRLRPLTYRIPKPLVPVMGKPLIMHVIDSIPSEVDEVIVPIGYKREAMDEYLRSHPPARRITLVDEPEPLGTGGAVKAVEDLIDGRFLVINGDVITSLDVGGFLRFHRSKGGIATISLWPVEDPSPFGVAQLDDDSRITRFQEKPKREEAFSNLINAGAYALEREVLEFIGDGFVSMEREVFPKLLEKGMYGYEFKGHWIDCGTRENLLNAFKTLMGNNLQVSKNSVSGGSILKKPSVVGEGAVVAGAVIGPGSYVSNRCVVGPMTTVEGSVLYEDARVGTKCRVVDSIIDEGVSIPDDSEVVSQIVSRGGP